MAKLRRKGRTREAKLLLICCEGAVTEPQYFAAWTDDFPRVKISVTSPPNDESAPARVVQHAKNQMRKLRFENGDEAWLVVDRDQWPGKQLAILHQESTRAQLKLANSNPNFHLWLLAHFEPIGQPVDKDEIDLRLRSYLGTFNKTSIQMPRFHPLVYDAIRNAKAADGESKNVGSGRTRVYLLVQEILRLIELT